KLELKYIELFNAAHDRENWYNISSTSTGGYLIAGLIDEERKEVGRKISEALKGKFSGENHPLYGVKGENHPNFGSKRSKETRMKMSKAHKGRALSIESRE